jgi:hypothetical protein
MACDMVGDDTVAMYITAAESQQSARPCDSRARMAAQACDNVNAFD